MEMNRRGFLGTLVGGVVGMAAVRTWPFRVYSFPTSIVIPTWKDYSKSIFMSNAELVAWLNNNTLDVFASAHDRLIEDAMAFGDGSENLRTIEYLS